MNKVMIYPFTEEMIPIVMHNSLINSMEITSLVSLKGNGILDDEYIVDERTIVVSENFESELEKCEYICLGKLTDIKYGSIYNERTQEIIISRIKKAVNYGKKIIFFNNLYSNSQELKKFIPKDQQLEIINKSDVIPQYKDCIYNINTPVIFICSLLEGLNKFDVQLSLREKLLNDGYKILQVGSRQICELFEFYSYPEFMYSKDIEEKDKVLMFNNFIKKIEVENNPDIIILGIPGGVMPFSAQSVGDFGITMYEITQAVIPDCTVLCLPYGKYNTEDIAYYENIIKKKFNIDVDYFNLVPKIILEDTTERKGQPMYLTLDQDLVEKKIQEINKDNIFSLSKKSDVETLVEKIIAQFTKYGNIDYI